jgi:phosphoglucosamine mutase
MSERLFGTDGIRGRAGVHPLVDDFLVQLGRVVGARVRAQDAGARVVIGHDGRASGPGIVTALGSGLRASGAAVHEVGLCTTPSLAYLAAAGPFHAGVMVSASHNPAEDNGIKLFGHDGAKFPDGVEAELEAALKAPLPPQAPQAGALVQDARVLEQYVRWLREAFADLDLSGRRILVDCAHGGASELAARVLGAFGATPVTLNDRPDGRNINHDCGALHPEAAAQAVAARSCELGISLDGDADRGIVVDGAGRVLDGDALLAGLGRHHQQRGELSKSTVVATVMSNLALELWLAESGVRLLRTQVGDRFVAEAMRSGGFNLGGEKSGHMLFGADHGWRGDGLYTLLRVLRVLAREKIAATDFARGYQDYPQRLLNLKVSRRVPLEQLPALAAEDQALQKDLAGSGRSVIRFSGTELRLRLMVEARDAGLVNSALQRLEAAARRDGILAE